MNYRTNILCAAAAALVLAGCGEVQIIEGPGITGFQSKRTNGKDTVLIEQVNGGEITYTLNGKKVSRDEVPEELLKPFDYGGGNVETLGED